VIRRIRVKTIIEKKIKGHKKIKGLNLKKKFNKRKNIKKIRAKLK